MNRLFYVLTLTGCMLLFCLVSAQVPGELAITNPGFETGDLSGWNMWPGDDPKISIVTDAVSSGENAAKVAGGTGAFYKVVTNEVTLVPGIFYCFVAEVMIPSGDALQAGQSVYLASKVTTPSGETWFESAKVVTSDDDADVWNRLFYGLTYPADATELTVEFKWTGTGSNDAGSVYVDDIKVIQMEPPADVGNFGFEEPDDLYDWAGGWWTWAYNPVDPAAGEETWIDEDNSRSGEKSLAIIPQEWSTFVDTDWWGGFYCWTAQTPYDTESYFHGGDNIYMSAWVMTPGDDAIGGAVTINLELTFKDINGQNMSNLGYENSRVWSIGQIDESSTADEWHFLENFIICPEVNEEHTIDRVDCSIRLFQTEDAYGIVYVDDVFIARGSSTIDAVKPVNSPLPVEFSLSQNYPNPFNPATQIKYTLDKTQHVRLTVYDIQGKEAATLVDGIKNTGAHEVQYDASGLTSGIYFYKLEAESNVFTRKMMLIK
jgi:hypothetical protein